MSTYWRHSGILHTESCLRFGMKSDHRVLHAPQKSAVASAPADFGAGRRTVLRVNSWYAHGQVWVAGLASELHCSEVRMAKGSRPEYLDHPAGGDVATE
jgi:hypothetical protein